MNSNKHDIFPVPIWGYVMNSEKYHAYDYISTILKMREQTSTVVKSNQGGWQSQDTLHEVPVFREFLNIINATCNRAVLELNPDSPTLRVTEMWANVNTTGSYNHHHTHSGVLSGVFYLQVPENSGRLMLVNPSIRSDGHFIRVPNYSVTPTNLACILFPSWLEHYVEPNRSDKERISISFNTNFV